MSKNAPFIEHASKCIGLFDNLLLLNNTAKFMTLKLSMW